MASGPGSGTRRAAQVAGCPDMSEPPRVSVGVGWTPTQDDWARALPDLKGVGGQLQGPCPLCGGENRFYVRDSGRFFCRRCMADGREPERYKEFLDAAFPSRQMGARYLPHGNDRNAGMGRVRSVRQIPQDRTAPARRLWQASQNPEGTPARKYFTRRLCWPPSVPIPGSVAWMRRSDAARAGHSLPDWADGAVVFLYSDDGNNFGAVGIEALNAHGRRGDQLVGGRRHRRTIGTRRSAWFSPRTTTAGQVVVVEGECTALAAAWLYPGKEVRASGGTANLSAVARLVETGRPVLIDVDGDEAGRKAAWPAVARRRGMAPARPRRCGRRVGDERAQGGARGRRRSRRVAGTHHGTGLAASAQEDIGSKVMKLKTLDELRRLATRGLEALEKASTDDERREWGKQAYETIQAQALSQRGSFRNFEADLSKIRDAQSEEEIFEALGWPRAWPVTQLPDSAPGKILGAHGQEGALLVEGSTLLLSGAGGVAKSAFALSIALGVAMLEDGVWDVLFGDIFRGRGGKVLFVTYEDAPGEIRQRLQDLANIACHDSGVRRRVFEEQIHVLNFTGGELLFGPSGSYGPSHLPLQGWHGLWREADRLRPVLIVIDPVLAAYAGNQNDAAPVRRFLVLLASAAAEIGAGVLLIAHSNKESRGQNAGPGHPGNVSGSTAWTDAARGVLTMSREHTNRGDSWTLGVSKANYGPAFISCQPVPIFGANERGRIVGFGKGPAVWHPQSIA